jgi:hypothetical protein
VQQARGVKLSASPGFVHQKSLSSKSRLLG